MASVTICTDFVVQEKKIYHYFHFSMSICKEVMRLDAMVLVFLNIEFQARFFTFTLIKRLFNSSLLSAIRVVSFTYLRLLVFLLAILIPPCKLYSPALLMIFSAYKLNKQGDSKQPCRTPFSILNKSVVSCKVLTVAS